MKEVFADTSYFLALLNATDPGCEKARTVSAAWSARLVTTAWVLTELANSLSKQRNRQLFLQTLRKLRSNPTAVIIGPEQNLFEAGIDLFAARNDKDWSLTDCISFVVMERRSITDALSGDRHFEQAGFRALLR